MRAMAQNREPLFVDPALMQQAERVCKLRLAKDPENRAVLRSLAEVYRKQGNLTDAAAAYERLFQLDPGDQEAGYVHAVLAGRDWAAPPKGIRAAPFVLVKNFLPAEFHARLLPLFVSLRETFVPVLSMDHSYRPDIRQTLELLDDWEGRKRFQEHLAEHVPAMIPRLHLPRFTIGRYEVQVRAYQDGHFFMVHQDAPPIGDVAGRVLNYVYYFHKQPRPFSGGELLLFDSDIEADTLTRARFTRIVPEDNSLVVFPCNFYHSVVRIECPGGEFADSRFTINGHVHKC
jgi:SM-20-related protein